MPSSPARKATPATPASLFPPCAGAVISHSASSATTPAACFLAFLLGLAAGAKDRGRFDSVTLPVAESTAASVCASAESGETAADETPLSVPRRARRTPMCGEDEGVVVAICQIWTKRSVGE